MEDKPVICEVIIMDNGVSIGATFECNLAYFSGNREKAKKVIQSTVEHFRNQMIENGLAVPKNKVTLH